MDENLLMQVLSINLSYDHSILQLKLLAYLCWEYLLAPSPSLSLPGSISATGGHSWFKDQQHRFQRVAAWVPPLSDQALRQAVSSSSVSSRGYMSKCRDCDWGLALLNCHELRARLWRRGKWRTGLAWISQSSLPSPHSEYPFCSWILAIKSSRPEAVGLPSWVNHFASVCFVV